MTNEELIGVVEHYVVYYISNGYRHNGKISFEKAFEIYYDEVIDKVLNDLPEMPDKENDEIVERINNLF